MTKMTRQIERNAGAAEVGSAWKDWWTYETHALAGEGPRNWATVNEAWRLCRVGRRQSPVDVPLAALVFAPSLPPLVFIGDPVSGTIQSSPVRSRCQALSFLVYSFLESTCITLFLSD